METNPNTTSALDDFLSWLTSDKRASPHTIKNYAIDLHLLFKNFPDFTKISEFDIRRLIGKLHAGGISPRSLSRYLSSWRAFYNYQLNNKKFNQNPVQSVHPPKCAKTLPQTVSVDQLSLLLNFETIDPDEICNLAMFELLYSAGLRLAELVQININNLPEILNGELVVLGKRQKKRVVPIGAKAINAVKKWMTIRPQIIEQAVKLSKKTISIENALFINKKAKIISPRSVELRLQVFAKKRGLPFNVHPHMLRHSFASHVLQSSGDLRAVQEMLGHQSIATTQLYTNLDFNHLAKVYDKAHPRARK